MSKSFKKTKKRGVTSADSEKQDKQLASRKYRRIVKQKVNNGTDELPQKRATSDIWTFDKDGKYYSEDMDEKCLRK